MNNDGQSTSASALNVDVCDRKTKTPLNKGLTGPPSLETLSTANPPNRWFLMAVTLIGKSPMTGSAHGDEA